MKSAYVIISLFLAAIVAFWLSSCQNKQKPAPATKVNNYTALREVAFSMTPQLLNLELPADSTVVYGIIMDWEMDGGVATTVAFQTGDASIYLSSGGGYIGGEADENVSYMAKQFVQFAQFYIDKTTKTAESPLPEKEMITFYFLTNNGLFVAQESMENFESGSSEWFSLFEKGNELITLLRLSNPEK